MEFRQGRGRIIIPRQNFVYVLFFLWKKLSKWLVGQQLKHQFFHNNHPPFDKYIKKRMKNLPKIIFPEAKVLSKPYRNAPNSKDRLIPQVFFHSGNKQGCLVKDIGGFFLCRFIEIFIICLFPQFRGVSDNF